MTDQSQQPGASAPLLILTTATGYAVPLPYETTDSDGDSFRIDGVSPSGLLHGQLQLVDADGTSLRRFPITLTPGELGLRLLTEAQYMDLQASHRDQQPC